VRVVSSSDADLVAGGLPASEALASATSAAPRACEVADRNGQLKPGFDADLIKGDPTANIHHLARMTAVIVQGSIVPGLPGHASATRRTPPSQ
jgi:imidazolonepropionase-like amidohydrolase